MKHDKILKPLHIAGPMVVVTAPTKHYTLMNWVYKLLLHDKIRYIAYLYFGKVEIVAVLNSGTNFVKSMKSYRFQVLNV